MKLDEIVSTTPVKMCAKYNNDTGNCTTGCKGEGVKRDYECPFGKSDQHNCECFAEH